MKIPTEVSRFNSRNLKQRGLSAIFIVIFATVLLSLISVSFIGLMLKDSSRSTDDEQSQGAYDAAMAGIEDGKRVLLECTQGSGAEQLAACNAIDNQDCSTVIDAGIAGSATDKEVAVTSTTGTNELNLAYTCVTISPNTPDYVGVLDDHDSSSVIPLRSASGFSYVDVYWFDDNDATAPDVVALSDPDLPPLSTASWPADSPPIMRAQVMQYSSGDLDSADFDDGDFARTLYLYPSQTGISALSFALDNRRSGSAEPEFVACANGSYPVSGYSCYVRIAMPSLPSGGPANRIAYLRLTSLYNGANYRVELRNSSGDLVDFDNVQPSIDSTGRANDLFRRVETRVGIVSDIPYPRATVDINNSFCKTFSVGAVASDYDDGITACDPNN